MRPRTYSRLGFVFFGFGFGFGFVSLVRKTFGFVSLVRKTFGFVSLVRKTFGFVSLVRTSWQHHAARTIRSDVCHHRLFVPHYVLLFACLFLFLVR
jgi:hypothetical protein